MASSPTARHIDVNGTQLYCEEIGNGDPIVLVHAGICGARMWDPQIEALSRDHQVVRYDMRGYGRSSIPPEPFAHHDDLLALFEALALGPAIIVGASYGGEVATAFTLEHPELVRGLVLVNTLAGMREPSDSLRAGWRAVNEAMDAGDTKLAVETETRMWVDGPHRTPDEVDATVREQVIAMNAAIFARTDEIEAAEQREPEPPLVERLGAITAPTLVIVGMLDQPDAIESAETLAREIAHARLERIEDAAHLPSMERPERFNRMVLGFVSDL
jgi:pimeloyl-ACP methyl ester carboxylesterase